MNIEQAKKLIRSLYLQQLKTGERYAVELIGGPGVGKSALVAQLCEELSGELHKRVEFSPFWLSTIEQPDVRGYGLPDTDADGTRTMVFTRAPWMPQSDATHGILALEEFGQASYDVQKPVAELLLTGCVGESALPIGWMVLTLSNREKDRSAVNRTLAFLQNRVLRIEIEPALDPWVNWAYNNGINSWAIAFAQARPNLVFADSVPEKTGPFCTPRSLCKLASLLDVLSDELLAPTAEGYLGAGTAAEFLAFLQLKKELPTYEEIIARPLSATLPKKTDCQYAVMQLVAYRADAATCVPAFTYLRRLPKEFQVAAVKATLKRSPALMQSAELSDWLATNEALLVAALS